MPLVAHDDSQVSSGSEIDLSDNDREFVIHFDDFPDNSLPDLAAMGDDLPDEITVKFKDYESTPDFKEIIDEQGEFGVDVHAFPSAMINGCVNIISGEYQETATDFLLPGGKPFELQRHYCGAGCQKHSLLYGWQLSQGAKLLTYQIKRCDYAVIKGSDRHGVRFKKPMGAVCFTCPESFFLKSITNCSLGEINAQNNFKNDRIYTKHHAFELVKSDQSRYLFVKSSHDPERHSSIHGYRLEKIECARGSSYLDAYSTSSDAYENLVQDFRFLPLK